MVERDDFTVESEPDIRLFVREIRHSTSRGNVPVVLVHGARVPGLASFDLPVPGGSLAEDLALAGHRVFVIDARGYGGSTRRAGMNADPMESPPLVRSSAVVRDLDGVVRAIRDRTGTGRVALLGRGTGGMWAGHYSTMFPGQRQPPRPLQLALRRHARAPVARAGFGFRGPDTPRALQRPGARRLSAQQ